MLTNISVHDLAHTIATAAPDSIQLIDVREPWEVEMASIPGFTNLPLSQAQAWSQNIHARLEADKETLVLCHHGIRSQQMGHWLVEQGFTNVKNISGGIAAYSSAIDGSIPKY